MPLVPCSTAQFHSVEGGSSLARLRSFSQSILTFHSLDHRSFPNGQLLAFAIRFASDRPMAFAIRFASNRPMAFPIHFANQLTDGFYHSLCKLIN